MTWLREIMFRHRHLRACRKLAAHREKNLRELETRNWNARSSAAKRGWQRRKMVEN